MTLKPFQEIGAEWLSSRRCAILADEMGLGKSAQAIVAADALLAERILIVCPAVARINWAREFSRFSDIPREFQIITKRTDFPSPTKSLIYSYDLLNVHRKHGMVKGPFDVLIVDEAHFVKERDAVRTQSVYGPRGVCHEARYNWALTGTPVPNDAGELWVLLRTFGRTKLDYHAFVTYYCEFAAGQGPFSPMPRIVGTKKTRIPELKALLAPIMLRRLKRDVLPELPPVTTEEVVVPRGDVKLSPEMQREVDEQLARLEIIERMTNAEAIRFLEMMAQSVSTLRRYLGLQKVSPVAEIILEEMAAGYYSKLVLFAVHREVVAMMMRELEALSPVAITGDTSPNARQEAIDRFQNDPACHVFVGNIQAAGTALTLTASHHVDFLEQEWVPSSNDQARDRVHRIGQLSPVHSRIFTVADSIDEKINGILRRKNRDIAQILS